MPPLSAVGIPHLQAGEDVNFVLTRGRCSADAAHGDTEAYREHECTILPVFPITGVIQGDQPEIVAEIQAEHATGEPVIDAGTGSPLTRICSMPAGW